MGFAGVDVDQMVQSVDNKQESQPQSLDTQNAQGTETTQESPAGANPDTPQGTETLAKTAQEILDLDKLERVRWGGKEWSIKDLQNATLRQEDYSRKTAEVKKQENFARNYIYDLRTVLTNPNRLDEFKKVYPKEYVQMVEEELKLRGNANQPKPEVSPASKPDPRFDEMYGEFQEWKENLRQSTVEKDKAWLENQIEVHSKKYDMADVETVLARAQVVESSGERVTEKVMEKLFKDLHDKTQERWEKKYQAMNSKQKAKSEAGKDIGPGGAIPGQAPVKPKSMKEARAGLFSKFD